MTEASGFPSWARVGARVVCIDAADNRRNLVPDKFTFVGDLDGLTEGTIYTVAATDWHPAARLPCIHLAEIHRSVPCDYDCGFDVTRFRPAVEDSDELGIETIFYRKAGLKSKSPVRTKERA